MHDFTTFVYLFVYAALVIGHGYAKPNYGELIFLRNLKDKQIRLICYVQKFVDDIQVYQLANLQGFLIPYSG